MTGGEVLGRDAISGRPVRLAWSEGRIVALDPVPTNDTAVKETWLAPLLVDLQVNGFAGVDFQSDQVTADDLSHAARRLLAYGCGRFWVTLVTNEWSRLLAQLRRLRQLRQKSMLLKRAIAGWHIEGPFLSSEPGYTGAHDPRWLRDPSLDLIQELRQSAGKDPLLITVAPERAHAIESIAHAVQLGITVCLGHTNASASQLVQAVQAGARGFTHLSNACPRHLDRYDNILWRVCDLDEIMISLIPDGVHVTAPLFRLLDRVTKRSSMIYVSDSMSAAASPPGRYTLGSLVLEVGADQIVHLPGSALYAGSTLGPITGIFRAADMLGRSWQDVWSCYVQNPCQLAGLPDPWQVGQPADFCLIEVDSQNRPVKGEVYVNGVRQAGGLEIAL